MTGRNECKVREESVSWNEIQGYSSGKYYRLCLGESPHIEYVDSNFCEMLGYTEGEICELFQNQYEKLVHPDDREKYRHFLDVMSSKETSVMMEYRLQNKAGESICVRDTMTTRRFQDGSYNSFSAVIDITDLKESYDEAETVNNVVSCGVIKFTCERYPKVLFVNKGMAKLLGIDRSSSPFLEDVRNNIYFLFPFEEKERFRRYLELADKNRGNVNFKISIYQEHGGRKTVTGWIRKVRTESRDEYEGFFLDSEICSDNERLSLQNCFVDALMSAHDTVFEINLEESTIKCLNTKNPTAKKAMVGVRMLLKDAVEYWCDKVYPQEKRLECKEFFEGLSGGIEEQNIKTLEFGIKGSFSFENAGGGSKISDILRGFTIH